MLVKVIDPLHSAGADLQDIIMRCTRTAIGDVNDFFDTQAYQAGN